jgi:hypothetical protein
VHVGQRRGQPIAKWWLIAVVACSRPHSLEVVGDPLGDWRSEPDQAYARSLWALQPWHGKLYLGYGDAVTNTGPTQVIAFDPATSKFETETTLDEEAIFTYRVIGDRMFVPGADAIDDRDGAIYIRDRSGWTTRPLEQAAHVNDVARSGDKLCVALQGRIVGSEVRCSHDDGATWESHALAGWRASSLFTLGGHLYVSSYGGGVAMVGGSSVRLAIPGATDADDVIMRRPTACGDDVVFMAARAHGQIRRTDLGVFRASAGAAAGIEVSPIAIDGTPANIFASSNACYVLTNTSTTSVAIYESRDGGATWAQRQTFAVPALATSAALMDGYFYVGLGCTYGEPCSALAGRLMRIRE